MPFAPHLRLTLIGDLGNDETEHFSYGVNLSRGTTFVTPFSEGSAVYDDIAEAAYTFHINPASRISPHAVLRTVKIADIGADGKYTRDPIVYTMNGAQGLPGQGTHLAGMVPQGSLAISLLTDERGPTKKGRFYLPLPCVAPDPDTSWLIPLAAAEEIRGSVRLFLDQINAAPGLDVLAPAPVVASTKGYNTLVTGVRVGRVVDTVRSRRRSLAENYTSILPLT